MGDDDYKKSARIRFEIEADADELFRKALENIDPSAKEEETEREAVRSRRTRKVGAPVSLDLHGLSLSEAELAVDRFLGPLLRGGSGRVDVLFITGKGRHSGPDGSVLPRGIHHYVKTKWAKHLEYLESSPADTQIGGLPIRGHFSARFRC